MKKLLALTTAAIAIFAGRVSAAGNLDEKYFTVDENSIVIEEITERGGTIPGPGQLPKPPSGPVINPPITPPGTTPGTPGITGTGTDPQTQFNNAISNVNSTVGALDAIVNLMDKIWGIIEKNQPVVNITTNYANAVPFGTSHWTQLQGWSKPAVKKYSFAMKNAYGTEVSKVVYQVHYTYAGNFQGKGMFLPGVTIEPISVVTAWGYKVTLVSEVPDSSIANVGTHEDPIAAMQLQLKWVVHTAIKDISSKAIYYVRGDGKLEELGTPFNNAKAIAAQKKIDAVKETLTDVRFN